ncbi:FAD-binding protein [Stenotrophomonas sp. CFBP8980]|uniref:FAD-binding protein n=1 Tax=Stenotrophomonas sp. CFBP8980 TaxID=3096523 RepID=UPI002A6A63FA|nr:FAD-binding protein [Stenotrophomonas sp. CFBP8980]MDY1033906.1 FAD-binding protein [Stenotrophomonas sp. CFBP8980]
MMAAGVDTDVDVVVAGAGPAGLMCAYLGSQLGLRVLIADHSAGPLQAGRADALNARTLQLLQIVDLFDDLYPHGKPCNTSSVWAEGAFASRQSDWWDALQGCFHRHFLMIGQSFVEQLLDQRLRASGIAVQRGTAVTDVQQQAGGCLTRLSDGRSITSRYVIGADGAHSFVREQLRIPFEVTRPRMTWAVVDGVIDTDFPKVPEIIVFQAESSDVAWIPREGELDRFYVRMDTREFTFEQVMARINRATRPYSVRFSDVRWFSKFSVKEAVAARFAVENRVFLVGDACHIHSVHGGQGLNTALADAFNLMWKIGMVVNQPVPAGLLGSYEAERKPVALGVVETSRLLGLATRDPSSQQHATDYVGIVAQRSGYVTGMGVRYAGEGLAGERVHDVLMGPDAGRPSRLYPLLDYRCFTLLVCGTRGAVPTMPSFVQVLRIDDPSCPYAGLLVLVRPDSHIATSAALDDPAPVLDYLAAFGSATAEGRVQ